MMGKELDPRDIDVHEIVRVIENFCNATEYSEEADYRYLIRSARELVQKLVGPERESESRWSSRHVVVDEEYCEKLADSLAISVEEAYDFFIGEPVRGAEKVAAWALEEEAKTFAGLDKEYEPETEPLVHTPRGKRVADMLQDWAMTRHRGVYRQRQDTRQASEATIEESA